MYLQIPVWFLFSFQEVEIPAEGKCLKSYLTLKFHTQNCLTTTAAHIIDKAMLDSERACCIGSK